MSTMMNVFMSFSDAYAPYAGVSLISLLRNCSIPVHFYLLSQDISKENIERITHIFTDYPQASVDFVHLSAQQLNEVRSIYQDISKPVFHEIVLYRLFVADILPESLNSVLFLDTDILVRGDISDLADLFFNDDIALYAVPDEFRMLDYHRIHCSPLSHDYFNAGVMFINLSYWRKNSVRKNCFNYLSEDKDSFFFLDQDLLNLVCATKVGHLHQKYNFFAKHTDLQIVMENVPYNYFDEALEAKDNPIIVHFCGRPRPWFKDDKAPYADEWWNYLYDSEWRNTFKPRYSQGSDLAYYWFWIKNLRKNLAALSPFLYKILRRR